MSLHTQLLDAVSVYIGSEERGETCVVVEVIAPALTQLASRLFEFEKHDIAELLIRRIGMLADDQLLSGDIGQVTVHLHCPPIGHRFHIVAEKDFTGFSIHEDGGSKRSCRAACHQRQFYAPIAVHIFGSDQTLEIE